MSQIFPSAPTSSPMVILLEFQFQIRCDLLKIRCTLYSLIHHPSEIANSKRRIEDGRYPVNPAPRQTKNPPFFAGR
jgi:hypothetical protein